MKYILIASMYTSVPLKLIESYNLVEKINALVAVEFFWLSNWRWPQNFCGTSKR